MIKRGDLYKKESKGEGEAVENGIAKNWGVWYDKGVERTAGGTRV